MVPVRWCHGSETTIRADRDNAGKAESSGAHRGALDVWPTYAVGVIVVVLSVVLSLIFPVHLGGADGCTDVVIIGVRGSGQQGFGDQVEAVIDAASVELWGSGRSVSEIVLEYPAVSITDSFGLALFNGDYEASVNQGVAALADQLDDLRNDCPSSPVILVGYSQGAQVIKLATIDRAPIDRIASVVLLADPVRETTQLGVVRTLSQEGAGSFGSLGLAESIRPIAIDVCALTDPICTGQGFDFSAHVNGYVGAGRDVAAHVVRDVEAFIPWQTTPRIS